MIMVVSPILNLSKLSIYKTAYKHIKKCLNPIANTCSKVCYVAISGKPHPISHTARPCSVLHQPRFCFAFAVIMLIIIILILFLFWRMVCKKMDLSPDSITQLKKTLKEKIETAKASAAEAKASADRARAFACGAINSAESAKIYADNARACVNEFRSK